jgi:hypothetical protein
MIGFALALVGPWACSSGGGNTTGSGGSSSSATSTHSASVVTTTGTAPSSGNLANPCMSDSDCGGDLGCTKDSASDPVFGGGPAGGYCTQSCSTDSDCPGSDSACLSGGSGMPGTCVLTCTIGPSLQFLNDPLDPSKCRGRNDLRCVGLTSGSTVCMPTCGEDSQCPTGRVCDPRTAVCVDKANVSTGKPDGAKCDPMATTPDCAGICVSFDSGETTCSRNCVLGGDQNDPQDTPNCGGVTSGLCVYRPSANGAGDFGFCAPACTAQDQCQNPAFWCFPVGGLTDPDPTKGIQNGFCFGATPCPNGDADCASAKGTSCTSTKDGPFCLNPMFPLGSEANPDAGTDGGGGSGGSGSTTSTTSTTSGGGMGGSGSTSSASSTTSTGGGMGGGDAGP